MVDTVQWAFQTHKLLQNANSISRLQWPIKVFFYIHYMATALEWATHTPRSEELHLLIFLLHV
jgi:hypothetical protein